VASRSESQIEGVPISIQKGKVRQAQGRRTAHLNDSLRFMSEIRLSRKSEPTLTGGKKPKFEQFSIFFELFHRSLPLGLLARSKHKHLHL
jgi:hypothetical protein